MVFGYDQYHSLTLTVKGVDMEMERTLTIFTTIDLSNSLFQGRIPNVVGKLNSLRSAQLLSQPLYKSHSIITGKFDST